MKNACVVLRKTVTAMEHSGLNAVLDELFLGGYALDEIRYLPQAEGETLKEAILSLKKNYENIFVFADKTALPVVRGYLSSVTAGAEVYADFANAAIYDDKKTVLCLLSQDKTDTGVNYVKNACIPFLQKRYALRFDKIVIRSVGANPVLMGRLLAETDRLAGNKISCRNIRKYDEDIVELVYDSNTPKMLADDL